LGRGEGGEGGLSVKEKRFQKSAISPLSDMFESTKELKGLQLYH